MGEKYLKKILVMLLILSCLIIPNREVKAENIGDIVDGSYLTDNDTVEGSGKSLARGIDLQMGTSKLSNLGEGKVAIIGITFAQRIVKEISVKAELQCLNSGDWETVETWSEEDKDTAVVQVSKTLEVEPGFYRLYCTHTANKDTSYSFTDALFID